MECRLRTGLLANDSAVFAVALKSPVVGRSVTEFQNEKDFYLSTAPTAELALQKLWQHVERAELYAPQAHLNFSCDPQFLGQRMGDKDFLIIPADSAPKEWAFMQELVREKSRSQELAALQEIPAKRKMLLHICCGPDAAGVIGQLKENFELLCFWYDPNIQPKAEYDLRLAAFEKVARLTDTAYVVGEYDADNFLHAIRGLEASPEQGAKCTVCYDLRLDRSAFEAQKQSCDVYATTLAISPHKVQAKLKAFGELGEKKYGVPYYAKNFMKHDGFKASVQFTEDHSIYRQDYCGCYFSLHEGGPKAQQMAQELGFTLEALKDKTYLLPEESSSHVMR